MRIGIIAEDRSDIAVFKAITNKLTNRGQLSIKPFVAMGCGKLRRKCAAWALNLIQSGCSYIVIVHDLDKNDEVTLRDNLTKKIAEVNIRKYIILIPIREIESWLLADPEAIRSVFNFKKAPKVPKHPETLLNPKEHLRDLIWSSGHKRYLNTAHNDKIAEKLSLARLDVCPSFKPYPEFIARILK